MLAQINETKFPSKQKAANNKIGGTLAFISEADLINAVVDNLQRFVSSNDTWVASLEVSIGAGTVDIVLAKTDKSFLTERLTNGNKNPYKVSPEASIVINNMYVKKSLKAATIARKSKFELKQVCAILDQLVTYGICTQTAHGTYVRTDASDPFSKLISLEGKLQNWKKALTQAHRNRLFSENSYVILDAKYAKPAIKNLDKFREYDVGLAIADAVTREVSVISYPKSCHPVSTVFSWIAKEALTDRVVENKALFSEGLKYAI